MTSDKSIYSNLARALLLLLLMTAPKASATDFGQTLSDNDSTEISLIINSPGPDIYELEGHATIRIKRGAIDYAVNYGVFDFDSPNFVGRFVSGQTDYIVAAYPFSAFLRSYGNAGRGITEYTLNLTPDEAQKLTDLLSVNLLPQNRTYRYNYVKDNCATRPLDMIERAVGGEISFPKPPASCRPSSFRDAMRNHHANYPWYQFGIDLALGSGIDYPISNREMAFSPELLGEMLPSATIVAGDGTTRALVKSTTKLLEERPEGTPAGPTIWYMTPMSVALLLLAITLIITLRDLHRRRVTRWWDFSIFTLQGIAGIVLAYLVFISVHEATSPNWLLLWLNPLCMIVPTCIYIKKCKGLVFCYEIVNFVALIILSVVWPFVNQSGNYAFIPLIVTDAMLSGRYIYIFYAKKS
ncbi:MAG: DUF4105 domain-containing protein [Muribaculum sp.]|nr:DUF4105 domain-containing protein [Muribaculum sp.]